MDRQEVRGERRGTGETCSLCPLWAAQWSFLCLAFSPGTLGHAHVLPEDSFKWSAHSLTHLAAFWGSGNRENEEIESEREGSL